MSDPLDPRCDICNQVRYGYCDCHYDELRDAVAEGRTLPPLPVQSVRCRCGSPVIADAGRCHDCAETAAERTRDALLVAAGIDPEDWT